jgi:hypothetical protein
MSVFPAGVAPPEETFALWQPRYAAHGILTFPVEIIRHNKKPMIEHYLKIGWRYSTELTRDPRCATAIGAPLGKRTGLFIADLDSTDPAIVPEGERLFGSSPILWRTGGGKFAMPFRWNGERRLTRAFGVDGLPIDALGGGFAVLPPSLGEIRRYEFLRGSLADFERLPVARIPDEIADIVYGRIPEEIARKLEARSASPTPLRAVKQGRRNDQLYRALLWHAKGCDDYTALLDVAETISAKFDPPLPASEVAEVAASAWKRENYCRRIRQKGARAEGPSDRDRDLH